MSDQDQLIPSAPSQILPVLRGQDFVVTDGANLGDPAGPVDDMELADVFTRIPGKKRQLLSVAASPDGDALLIAPDSEIGKIGSRIDLDYCATFMDASGETVDVICLVETEDGLISETYLLPLAKLRKKTRYSLVTMDTDNVKARFSNLACASFARSTRITLADGHMVPIEELSVGDEVLTRDNGAQPIRWIGHHTVRATGNFAPITIAKGTLNNENDLLLGPNHRLFFYQRQDHLGAGRSEITVKARLLVNGDTVVQANGGFIDYFQLLFDQHEIIYAEGIAAESMYIGANAPFSPTTGMQANLSISPRADDRSAPYEIDEKMLGDELAIEVIRRATSG